LASFAVAAARGVFLSPDWAAPELLWPLVLIGVGQAFLGVAMLRFATWESIRRSKARPWAWPSTMPASSAWPLAWRSASHTLVEREKFHSARLVEGLDALDGGGRPAAGRPGGRLRQLDP
jgi:DHA2 family multidrug resistance protein